jgi:hypothetical protein
VAAARNGHARAILIPNAKRKTNEAARQYANPRTGAHINTVEAVNTVVQRALIGVYHRLGRKHLQRYLDEILALEPPRPGGEGAEAEIAVWLTIDQYDSGVKADPGRRPDATVALCRGRPPKSVATPAWGLRWP